MPPNSPLKMTQAQADQKAKQIQMNKEAAQKLLAGLHASLTRNSVSTIQVSPANARSSLST
jgi:hypothetical protein